jgi:hypothetical protein
MRKGSEVDTPLEQLIIIITAAKTFFLFEYGTNPAY